MVLQPGDTAPNVNLQTLDGQAFSLADTWRSGRHVLLIFLRHLG